MDRVIFWLYWGHQPLTSVLADRRTSEAEVIKLACHNVDLGIAAVDGHTPDDAKRKIRGCRVIVDHSYAREG